MSDGEYDELLRVLQGVDSESEFDIITEDSESEEYDSEAEHSGMSSFRQAEHSGMSSSERLARIYQITEDVRTKQLLSDRLGLKLRRCTFINPDPEPGMDSTKIMGTICSLIQWYDRRFGTALEIVAGERLYDVVVDSEDTSMALMSKGNLLRNTTFIMLDIICGESISRETLKLAQQLGGGPENVKLALDLVSYESKYEPAMNWVFGNSLVVRDWDIAEHLAFHPSVECCCVTFDGDVCQPSGARTGGPKITEPSVFHMLEEHKELMDILDKKRAEIAWLTAEEEQARATATE